MSNRAFIASLIFCFGLVLLASLEARAGFSVNVSPAEFALEPGQTQMGSVLVTNSGDDAVQVKIYVGDWLPTKNGTQYLAPGECPRGVSRWMRASPARINIAPGSSEEVFYEVALPADPDLAGSYWGMVFVEEIPEGVEALPDESGRMDMAVRTVVRYALKVYVNISGTEIRRATFTETTLAPVQDGLDLAATLENQGNIYLRPRVWIELYDQRGQVVYTEAHKLRTVLPERTQEYRFELRSLSLSQGHYTALVIADYDAPNLIAAQTDIEVKD